MIISIKHLPKHEVFATLFNYAAKGEEVIDLVQAQEVINNHYNSQVSVGGRYYFDFYSYAAYRSEGVGSYSGYYLKIDLTQDTVDSSGFDGKYGAGVCAALVENCRQARIAQWSQEKPQDDAALVDLKQKSQDYEASLKMDEEKSVGSSLKLLKGQSA